MTEFQILSAIRNSGGSIGYVSLLNLGLTDPEPDHVAGHQRISHLKSKGCVSGKLDTYGVLRMEPPGTVLLDSLLQQRNQDDQQAKAETAKERKQIRFSVASAFLGAALTLAVELLVLLFAA